MTRPRKPAIATPTSDKGSQTPPKNPKQEFLVAAANMSWQLAIVVLVPILLGFRVDKHFDTLPLWTAIGFLLAMAGMGVVVWRQLQLYSPKITQADIENAKKLRDKEDEDQ